jgi:hypothetical protein
MRIRGHGYYATLTLAGGHSLLPSGHASSHPRSRSQPGHPAESDSPRNIDEAIDYAVSHDPEFHQFMLYTPLPGTPLHAEHLAKGTLKADDECSPADTPPADTHGQFRFNFRHPHIREGEETEFLLRAFDRDFEAWPPASRAPWPAPSVWPPCIARHGASGRERVTNRPPSTRPTGRSKAPLEAGPRPAGGSRSLSPPRRVSRSSSGPSRAGG